MGNISMKNKEFKKRVLISSFYSLDPLLTCLKSINVDRIILLVGNQKTQEQKKNLELAKKTLGKVYEIKIVKINKYDIYEIMKKSVMLIDKYGLKNNLSVNITGGRKTLALGLLFAAYSRKSLISKIVYSVEETNETICLPKLPFSIEATKKDILCILNQGQSSVINIAKTTNISRMAVYRHLKDLRDMGLIDEENHITLAGKMILL